MEILVCYIWCYTKKTILSLAKNAQTSTRDYDCVTPTKFIRIPKNLLSCEQTQTSHANKETMM